MDVNVCRDAVGFQVYPGCAAGQLRGVQQLLFKDFLNGFCGEFAPVAAHCLHPFHFYLFLYALRRFFLDKESISLLGKEYSAPGKRIKNKFHWLNKRIRYDISNTIPDKLRLIKRYLFIKEMHKNTVRISINH